MNHQSAHGTHPQPLQAKILPIKGSPAGRPLICFKTPIADFSNFECFVLGPQINNRTEIATEDVPRQGPSTPQVSAKSAERLLS